MGNGQKGGRECVPDLSSGVPVRIIKSVKLVNWKGKNITRITSSPQWRRDAYSHEECSATVPLQRFIGKN